MRTLAYSLTAFMLLTGTLTQAGGRVVPGGALSVALVSASDTVDPLTVDTPVDAAQLLLTHLLLCQVVQFQRPTPSVMRLVAPPGVLPQRIADTLTRVRSSTSVAKALLGAVTSWTVTESTVELQLKGAAPDLERMLCHPAFAMATGPFLTNESGQLRAASEVPQGRPFIDTLTLHRGDARLAERLLAQQRVKVVLGSPTAQSAPQLFATALVLGPEQQALREAIEATVSREDLARFFVPAPAAPLNGLLPASPPLSASAPRAAAPRDLSLYFNSAAPHEKAIAERIQVKLQPLGYRIALKPAPLTHFQTAKPSADELFIRSVALPPSAVGTLLVWLQVAGQEARIPKVIQELNSADANFEERLKSVATVLQSTLPVVPLVTRGLGVTVAPNVKHLSFDVLGLPRLDDVFLEKD